MNHPIRGRDGKFAGSEGTGKTNPPRAPRTGAQRAHDQRKALDNLRAAGGVVDPGYDQMLAAVRARVAAPDTDRGDTGRHPVYGGLNWGVRYQEFWNDYQVNHGYYGAIDSTEEGVYIDYSDVPLADNEVRWTSDQADESDAVTVWQYRARITQALRDRDFSARRSVRIRAEVEQDAIRVSPYDRASDFEPFVIPR